MPEEVVDKAAQLVALELVIDRLRSPGPLSIAARLGFDTAYVWVEGKSVKRPGVEAVMNAVGSIRLRLIQELAELEKSDGESASHGGDAGGAATSPNGVAG